MANYQISENPTFILAVKALEALDYAHADLFNAIYQVLLDNDNYLDKHKADVNHTHDDMVAATVDKNGKSGLVPAPAAGSADRYLRSDGSWQTPPNDNTTYGNMGGATASAAGKSGLVPAPSAGNADRYLRSDGTWQKPPNDNTTYGNMKAATASAAGGAGLVPAPAAGAQGKYLRGDGTWQTPPDTNTTYSAATQSANGLMSAADKKKLDGVAASANNYSHPTGNGNNHIPSGGSSGQILRWSAAGTAAWGADNNTTYGAATQSANGLMSAADKKKLDGVASGANVTPSGLSSGYVRTGQKSGTTIGDKATAEGLDTTASGARAHAEGQGCQATASNSHAGGTNCKATDVSAHAHGDSSEATKPESTAMGWGAKTGASHQLACGSWNAVSTTKEHGLFIVGNGGSNSSRSNAFRVTGGGAVYAKAAYNASGADYAEYFEWEDGNPSSEDRRGYFVSMEGDKIRLANPDDDYILGVISGKPSVIGNSDPDDWHSHFLTDEFGEFIKEKATQTRKVPYEVTEEETYIDEDGNEVVRAVKKMLEREVTEEVDSYIVNPDYDPDKPYIPRSERPEWAAVGMLGVLVVHDDGTCQVNGYCNVADEGMATASDAGYRVIKRVNDHLVKIMFR